MIRIFRYCMASVCSVILMVQTATLTAQNHAKFELTGIGVPDSVMAVVKFCTDEWSKYVYSDVPIRVSVSWQELEGKVNAYAKPANYYAIDGIYYPAALMEKKQKKNLNGNEADIEVAINDTLKWYVDVNNIPTSLPSGVQDLASTLLHELAHGLGYVGSITEANLQTSEFDVPTIFDMFVSDDRGNPIVTRTKKSFELNNSLLTSEALYWNGCIAKSYCGQMLKLYAPKSFNSGSTVYHLDENSYPYSDGFAMMTPQVRNSDIFRKPDIATLAMLADIGWNDYFIQHTIPQNSSNLATNTIISFSLVDTLLQKDNQKIIYSFDAGRHIDSVDAIYNEEAQMFMAEIPTMQFDHTISYKIRSITSKKDTFFFPHTYPNEYFSVFIGDDVVEPVIEHDPLKKVKATVNKATADIVFSAGITDNFEIDSAYVMYFFSNKKDTLTINFPNQSDFSVSLAFSSDETFTEKDFLYYKIVAVDKAGNTTYTNDNEYYKVPFEYPADPMSYLSTVDFENKEHNELFRLDGFSISEVDGFDNMALHTDHPYKYSGSSSVYVQYTATLKKPIILTSNPATMTFDEVVLVEPGKVGIPFGTFGFWDYVVVEGSKDEENWYPLGKKGWDSQLWDDWYQLYHSQKKNDGKNENSLAIGDASYYKKHTINLLENKYFRTGDTVFIRFRLQSDETNYAWGWAIDNVEIQKRLELPIVPLAPAEIELYPNPCSDWLYVSDSQLCSVDILDVTGTVKIKTGTARINVSSLPKGIYIARILLSSGEVRTQKFVKQ